MDPTDTGPDGPYEGVVVLGAPRSGTTLLQRLLGAHPDVCCPPETRLFVAAAGFLDEEPVGDGLALGVTSALWFSDIAEDQVLERLRALVFGLLDAIAEAAGKRVWAEKTGANGFVADAVERLCGDRCRYLVLTRHGADVACSLADLVERQGRYTRFLHPYIQRHPAPLEAFAHAWVDVHRRLLRFERDHPATTLRLRYEQLVSDPVAVLDRLFAWLGLRTSGREVAAAAFEGPLTPGLGDWKVDQTTGVHTDSVGRFAALSPHTRAVLAPILEETLGALGYDPLPTGRVVSGAAARRRHQLGQLVARMKRGQGA